MSNPFLAAIATAIHAEVSKISKIPFADIESVVRELPGLVAKELPVAASGFEKLQTVVAEVAKFLPEPYRDEAGSALVILTSLEVMIQKLEGVVVDVTAATNATSTATAPVATAA